MIRPIPTVVTIEALKPHRKCDHHRNLTPIGRRARSPEKQGQFRSLATLRLRRGLGLAGTVGLAQLQFGESSDDVIVRADADLCRQRHRRSHRRPPTCGFHQ